MDFVLNILLLAAGFVSVYPVIHIFSGRNNSKYQCLQLLMTATFFWTILIFIERLTSNMTIIYYVHMLGYPLKFLMASFMLGTIFQYIGKKLASWQLVFLGVLLIADFSVSITNVLSRFILDLAPAEMMSFKDLYTAATGPLFIYHLILSYAVLLISIIYLFFYLQKKREIKHYRSISRTMTYSVLIVLFFNAIQLTLLKSYVDITYISLVFVAFILYRVIYHKDMIFNLQVSGRGEILSNMREMYILMDHQHNIVEISTLLCDKYEIIEKDYVGKHRDVLFSTLSDKVVLYSEYDVNKEGNHHKDHLHIREKAFQLKGMEAHGNMALLYDETQIFSLLRELNQLSNFDSMTGLNNRNFMEGKLKQFNGQKRIGIFSLDLNGLKINNDYIGHERGDYLLKKLANIITESLASIKNKEAARIGGDEFLLLIHDTTFEELTKIKESILQNSDHTDLLEKVSVSVGISFDETGNKSIYDITHEADQMMYEMKRNSSKEYVQEIITYLKKQKEFIR